MVPGELRVTPAIGDPDQLDHEVVLRLDVLEDRLVCTSCEINMLDGGPPVNADALRRVPVARYLREAVTAGLAVKEVVQSDDEHEGVRIVGINDLPQTQTFVPPPRDFAEGGMSDEVLQQVARLYHWSLITGDAPLGILERDYNIPYGKASRWIATARRRGYVKARTFSRKTHDDAPAVDSASGWFTPAERRPNTDDDQ